MIGVLATAAAIVWGRVLTTQESVADRTRCPPPPRDAGLRPAPHNTLDMVTPAPPAQVTVLVRNATSRKGLATRVAARYELFGFPKTAVPDNDPIYPTDKMHCRGQIRFGPNGQAAASTASLIAPCLELVHDNREGPDVDVVLGTEFDELAPSSAVREVLRFFEEQATSQPQQTGGLQSAPGTTPNALPTALLTAARSTHC